MRDMPLIYYLICLKIRVTKPLNGIFANYSLGLGENNTSGADKKDLLRCFDSSRQYKYDL